ncbi:MAG: tetratricopeptide repeat protein, partial [Ferruginibacter sp.]|nr:tetratricopeptide repeat protein [Cytophagales bacterium]
MRMEPETAQRVARSSRPGNTLGSLLTLLCLTGFALVGQAQNPVGKARSLFESRQYGEAGQLLKAIDDNSPDYAEAQYYLGRIAVQHRQHEEAADRFREAVDANPKNADYHYWLGAAYGLCARDANPIRQGFLANKIKSEFEQTLRLDPNHQSATWGLVQFYVRAPGFMGGGKEKARQVANRLRTLNPAEGHLAMAFIHTQDKKMDLAEKEYLALTRAAPDSGRYVHALGNFYQNTQQYDKAFETFENFLKQTSLPNLPVVFQIGKTSALSGKRLERGESCLLSYLKHQPQGNEPSLAGANFRLGMIYEKQNRKAEARKHYEIALRL